MRWKQLSTCKLDHFLYRLIRWRIGPSTIFNHPTFMSKVLHFCKCSLSKSLSFLFLSFLFPLHVSDQHQELEERFFGIRCGSLPHQAPALWDVCACREQRIDHTHVQFSTNMCPVVTTTPPKRTHAYATLHYPGVDVPTESGFDPYLQVQ
jgi:hypothetical protein